MLSTAIGFMVDLERAEVVRLLRQRLRSLAEWRDSVRRDYVPEDGPEQLGHIGEIMRMWIHAADGEAVWTRGLIDRIEAGAYTFAGEGAPFVGILSEGEKNPYATGEWHPEDDH